MSEIETSSIHLAVDPHFGKDDECTQLMVVTEGGDDAVKLEFTEGGNEAVKLEFTEGTHTIVHDAFVNNQIEGLERISIELQNGKVQYLQKFSVGEYVFEQSETAAVESVSSEVPALTTIVDENDNKNKYVCNFQNCNKTFTSKNYAKKHQRIHLGHRPFICTLCNKDFNCSYALKAHTRTHTGEKPYHCPHERCNKSFKTSGDLLKHIRIHTGEKPFECDECGKRFTTSNIKKVHMRVHTGEKPYVCTYENCNRRFASVTNYRNHCRIHTGEKPYICSVENCGRRFTEYSSLYKHHIVHNNKKIYYCSICRKHYRQLSTLTVHQKMAHGMTPTSAPSNSDYIFLESNINVEMLHSEGCADDQAEIISTEDLSASDVSNHASLEIKNFDGTAVAYTKVSKDYPGLSDDTNTIYIITEN